MGGEIFLGVRDPNEHETLMLRWTNEIPLWLADVDFYEKPEKLAEFLRQAKRSNRWPQARLVDKVLPSEYGVILIDFATKQIFSRQNFASPVTLSFVASPSADREDAVLVDKLKRAGWITRITGTSTDYERQIPKRLADALYKECSRIARARNRRDEAMRRLRDRKPSFHKHYGHFLIEYDPPGWIINATASRASEPYAWKSIKCFLRDYRWKAKASRQ